MRRVVAFLIYHSPVIIASVAYNVFGELHDTVRNEATEWGPQGYETVYRPEEPTGSSHARASAVLSVSPSMKRRLSAILPSIPSVLAESHLTVSRQAIADVALHVRYHHVRLDGEPFAQPKSLEISWRYAANPMALRPCF